jgi:Transposase IS4
MEYFLALLPIAHLNIKVELTNENDLNAKQKLTRPSEILRVFGVIFLITRFRFGKRETLWSSTRMSTYIPAPDFGITGITRARFRELRSAIRFSQQGDDTEMSSSQHRWSLVQGFVDAINSHRKEQFDPSEMICVDESISRWYGLGGSWIDVGLPHYVAIDSKPDNGCELQTSACGQSGVMLRPKIVVPAEDEAANIT